MCLESDGNESEGKRSDKGEHNVMSVSEVKKKQREDGLARPRAVWGTEKEMEV